MSSQLTGYGKKQSRRLLDFYPTPPEATLALLQYVTLPGKYVWEPACGNGAMSNVLKSTGYYVYSTDVNPGYADDVLDFLSPEANRNDFDAIITNPPFNLSIQFIEKALSLAPFVAMLLKSQYWHSRNRHKLFTTNPPAYVLPLTWRPDFMNKERGGRPTMEVLWTVWIRGATQTIYQPLLKPSKS